MNIKPELIEPLPNGLPRVSQYDEFLRITGEADTPDAFVTWTRSAYLLMQPLQNKQ